jgi:hypothetical protein
MGLWFSCIMALISISAFAGEAGPVNGTGHDVPSPFGTANQKVELADGEIYVLFGRVLILGEKPFFEVDFGAHPWLANEKRKADPYYDLEWSTATWKALDGQKVQLTVKAHGHIMTGPTQTAQYILSLEPLADPVPSNR